MAEKRTTKAAPASKAAASKGKRPQQGKVAKEINDTIRYTTWSVFKAATPLGDRDRAAVVREVEELVAQLASEDVVVRGFYDVAALRADADIVLWMHAATSDALQDAYHRFRRTALGATLEPLSLIHI